MLGAIFLRKKSVIFVPIFTFSLLFLLSNDTFKSLVVSFSRPNNWVPRTFAFAKYKQSTWKKTFVYPFIDTFSDYAEFSYLNNIFRLFNYEKNSFVFRVFGDFTAHHIDICPFSLFAQHFCSAERNAYSNVIIYEIT